MAEAEILPPGRQPLVRGLRGVVVHVHNVIEPWRDREEFPVGEFMTIRQWLDEQGIEEFEEPTICLFNGRALLREHWDGTWIGGGQWGGDVVQFVTLPEGGGGGGGGGSDAVRIVAMVAVIVASIYLGPEIATAMEFAADGTAAAMATAGVATVGMVLVNAVLPPPKPNIPSFNWNGGNMPAPSPTYSLQGQGNQARLEQPIPEWFGRHMIYPDLAADPYQEYAGNEQYLFQIHCIGKGRYDIEAIRIEDSPISSFDEITYEVVPPGGTPTLFDVDVVTAPEVVGQELKGPNQLLQGDDGWVGPFVVNPADSVATEIGIDVVMARGLYYSNDSGGLSSKTVQWEIQARPIDADGFATGDGSWTTLATESYTDATTTQVRLSYRYAVAGGRYEVRGRRLDDKDLSSRAGHEIRWQGLKGYLDSEVDWSTETILLVKMRATDNLSQRSSRLVNVIATRMLFAWDPVTGWSAEEVPTRSIAWAAAHVCRSENGWALPDSRIDLQGLWQLEQTWSARGDEFNGGFDSGVTVWDALQTIMRCGRAVAIQQRGIIRFVRDELKTVPTAFFGPRNIVKGSFSIKYILPGEDNADAVEIGYFSERNWKPARVTAKLADSSASKPAKVKMVGITKKEQGYREGYYIAADNRYRRRMVTFRTRLEALSCSYGDLAVISHPMPQWGQGGEVVEWDPDTGLMTVSEPLTWAEGVDHYIGLRKRDNALSGPWKVEAVPDQPRQLLVVEDLDITPYTGADEERTHFAFGPDLDWCRFAKIRGVRPRGNQVEVTAAIEDERVHEDPPPLA